MDDHGKYQDILVEVVNHVGWLKYNKPPINAFTFGTMGEIRQALEGLAEDGEVRVLVIASALEKHFCVGADLEFFARCSQEEMAAGIDLNHEVGFLVRQFPKPVLAAIHGTAVGGGLEVAMHADLRFAAEGARLGQPEVNIGFIPPIIATQTLVRLLGRPRAMRYLYEGTLLDAGEALRIGLVDELCPAEGLFARVQQYAEMLAAKPPEALEAIRRTITEGMDLDFAEAARFERDWAVRLAGSENFQEGVRAFLEKRPPQWKRD